MRFWKSVEILEKAIKGYERSKIDVKRYEIPFILLSVNLCARYEEIDRFEDSIHLTDKVIKNLISCKRGDELGFLVEEKTYTTDRMTGNNAKSIEKYRQSYQLFGLMKAGENEKAPLKRAYKEWYGEDIN